MTTMTPNETSPDQAERPSFQNRVDTWMDACFGDTIKLDRLERCDRFIEESLELVQTEPTFTAERAHALVDYVFGRAVGEPAQEVGGVKVTLAALCNTFGIDVDQAAETELARVWTKVDAIRAKQAAKPTGSALPIAIPTPPPADHTDLIAEYAQAVTFGGEIGSTLIPAELSRRVLDVLQAPPREWQDIATAPHEGRVLVVGGRYSQAEIVEADGPWWNTPANAGLKSIPTHWMPVPSFVCTALELG